MIPRVFVAIVGLGLTAMAAIPTRVTAQTGDNAAPRQHEDSRYHGPPVSLNDLLREAEASNPDLAALRSQIEAVRHRPDQARSLNAPTAEAQVWQWPLNSLNPANTNMYMFMVSQDLPGRGKRDLRAAVAEKDVALAEADVAVRARNVIGEVKQAYAQLFVARKAIDVHLQSVELLRQITDVSQAKYSAGRISQHDVLKPLVELSRLHADIFMFDEQAGMAAARLNVLLDRPPEALIGPLIEPREQRLLPATTDLQRLAIERQPDLRRSRIEIERAEAEVAAIKRESKPDFTVQAGYMLMPRMTDAWMGRVGITWPTAPWSRGRLDARIAEQTAAVEAARGRERAMENRV